jgi:hypothetical protein
MFRIYTPGSLPKKCLAMAHGTRIMCKDSRSGWKAVWSRERMSSARSPMQTGVERETITVEDLGLSRKRRNFWPKRQTNLNNRFRQ